MTDDLADLLVALRRSRGWSRCVLARVDASRQSSRVLSGQVGDDVLDAFFGHGRVEHDARLRTDTEPATSDAISSRL